MSMNKNDKSLGMLFSDLTRSSVDLVRKEIALGRAELMRKVSIAAVALKSVAIGAALLLVGAFLLLQALVGALALVLPPQLAPWLAPLIVGAVVVGAGYVTLKGGKTELKGQTLKPTLSINSLVQDKNVIKGKIH